MGYINNTPIGTRLTREDYHEESIAAIDELVEIRTTIKLNKKGLKYGMLEFGNVLESQKKILCYKYQFQAMIQ